MQVGVDVGADVAFFLSEYKSANVRGFGEIIEAFDEEVPELTYYTPHIECSTPTIYRTFRRFFKKQMDKSAIMAESLTGLKSSEILKNYEMEELNDLYMPAVKVDPEILCEHKEGYFFSGSGSSFFALKEHHG